MVRRLRAVGVVAAVLLGTGLAVVPVDGSVAAPKLGPVAGLTAAATGAGTGYDVTATWASSSGATTYRASLESRG